MTIYTLDRLKWDADLFDVIKQRIETAQANGDLTGDRQPITGDERIAWLGFSLGPDAFVLFYEARPRVMWIDILWVSEHRRKSGLGTQLMKHVADVARGTGYQRVELGTQITNRSARRLYEKLDFDERSIGYALELRAPVPPSHASFSDGSDDIPF